MIYLKYKTNNIGDDMQTHVLTQLLGRPSGYIFRKELAKLSPIETTPILFNGFLPKKQIPTQLDNVVYLAVSCVPALSDAQVEHFKRCAPIGCRDRATLKRMTKHDIPCYLSYCPTILYKPTHPTHTKGTLMVDFFPPDEKLISCSWRTNTIPRVTGTVRDGFFRELIRDIDKASHIITNRIHVTMPALASGKQVTFIRPEVADYRTTAMPSSFTNISYHQDKVKTRLNRQLKDKLKIELK